MSVFYLRQSEVLDGAGDAGELRVRLHEQRVVARATIQSLTRDNAVLHRRFPDAPASLANLTSSPAPPVAWVFTCFSPDASS